MGPIWPTCFLLQTEWKWWKLSPRPMEPTNRGPVEVRFLFSQVPFKMQDYHFWDLAAALNFTYLPVGDKVSLHASPLVSTFFFAANSYQTCLQVMPNEYDHQLALDLGRERIENVRLCDTARRKSKNILMLWLGRYSSVLRKRCVVTFVTSHKDAKPYPALHTWPKEMQDPMTEDKAVISMHVDVEEVQLFCQTHFLLSLGIHEEIRDEYSDADVHR